jgi:hypothetical protein
MTAQGGDKNFEELLDFGQDGFHRSCSVMMIGSAGQASG